MKRAFKVSPMLLGGIGVALAVLAAGGFFAIRAIEGNSPPPLTAPVALVSPTVSPAAAGTPSSPGPTATASTPPPSPTVTRAAAGTSSSSPGPTVSVARFHCMRGRFEARDSSFQS